jgi:plasmid stability protein
MCYNDHMDTTIRNIDENAYRELKARAALTGRTVGDLITEAIRAYLAASNPLPKRASLRDLEPEEYPEGNERLSESVDTVVYGV